jgi:hypothetical protein
MVIKNQYGIFVSTITINHCLLRLTIFALPGWDVPRLREREWEGPQPTGAETGLACDDP